jgi:hypothetical protein
MKNIYTWDIDSLECVPLLDGQANVVSMVNWRVKGTDGTHTVSVHGQQPLEHTSNSYFIDYSDLTLATVLDWIHTSMGAEAVASIEASLDSQIAILATPPIVLPDLPWKQNNV